MNFDVLSKDWDLNDRFLSSTHIPFYSGGGTEYSIPTLFIGEEFSLENHQISLLGIRLKKEGNKEILSYPELIKEKILNSCVYSSAVYFFRKFDVEEISEMQSQISWNDNPIIAFGNKNACLIIAYYTRNGIPEEFLVLDPRYQGENDAEKIIEQGYCGWKTIEYFKENEINFFLRN